MLTATTLALPPRTNIPRPTKKNPKDTPNRVFNKLVWHQNYGTEGVPGTCIQYMYPVYIAVYILLCTVPGTSNQCRLQYSMTYVYCFMYVENPQQDSTSTQVAPIVTVYSLRPEISVTFVTLLGKIWHFTETSCNSHCSE